MTWTAPIRLPGSMRPLTGSDAGVMLSVTSRTGPGPLLPYLGRAGLAGEISWRRRGSRAADNDRALPSALRQAHDRGRARLAFRRAETAGEVHARMAYEFQVTVDCAEPHVLADWWAETLGWRVEPQDEAFIRRMISAGHATGERHARCTTGRSCGGRGRPSAIPEGTTRAPRVAVPAGPRGSRRSRTGSTSTVRIGTDDVQRTVADLVCARREVPARRPAGTARLGHARRPGGQRVLRDPPDPPRADVPERTWLRVPGRLGGGIGGGAGLRCGSQRDRVRSQSSGTVTPPLLGELGRPSPRRGRATGPRTRCRSGPWRTGTSTGGGRSRRPGRRRRSASAWSRRARPACRPPRPGGTGRPSGGRRRGPSPISKRPRSWSLAESGARRKAARPGTSMRTSKPSVAGVELDLAGEAVDVQHRVVQAAHCHDGTPVGARPLIWGFRGRVVSKPHPFGIMGL